jgi:rifampicin phosphotransferase
MPLGSRTAVLRRPVTKRRAKDSESPRALNESLHSVGCVALGTGRITAAGIGAKAARLDDAIVCGVAVPPGFVVPHGLDVTGSVFTAAVVEWASRSGVRRLAVRSAFAAEDTNESSMAGWFLSTLRVSPADVAGVVGEVRSSASLRPGSFRRDVLVMAMVDATHAGVAFCEPDFGDHLVNVTTGTAERLVAGEEAGDQRLISRYSTDEAGWPKRLQRALSDVIAAFGDEAWDIEWADDGTTCWVVQVRPITRAARRNEAFTIANQAEILPPLPSTLMTSVIESAGSELFGWYRRFDRTLPANRPFLEVMAGRPFINLSLLEDLLRHLGLPTRLVADSIGGPPTHDEPARIGRIARKSPVLLRMGIAQITAVARSSRNERRAASFGIRTHDSFASGLDALRQAYVGLVTGMFPLSSAIGPPLSALRATGTLAEHASRHRTVTSELAEALDAVHRGDSTTAAFLDRFGHRGVYESDIARPRYRDDPTALGAATPARDRSETPAVRRTVRGVLTLPLWLVATRPIDARERFRDQAMVGFAGIRRQLVGLANRAVLAGQLRSVDDLWLLTMSEAIDLDRGWMPSATFFDERNAERARLADLDPPPVVHRFDDPADWSHDVPTGDRFRGLSLTSGTVTGQAWVLREPAHELPDGFDRQSTVLVARSVDAGWISTFALVAGVAVETGGDLSHGSILLRERGIPAITNTPGITRAVSTGDLVELRAQSGTLERRHPAE